VKLFKSLGFSLVELLIVGAGLAALATVGMQFISNMNKNTTRNVFQSEVNLITSDIVAFLSDPAKCFATLGGKNALNTSIGIINNVNNRYYVASHSLAPANGYGNGQVKIDSYSIRSTATDINSNLSNLNINFQTKQILKGSAGASTIPSVVRLYVEVDANNIILKCRSLSASKADIWTRKDNSNSIYYNLGKVGIGTNDPESNLHVVFDNQPIGFGNDFIIERIENTNDWSPVLMKRARGTAGALSNLQNGDFLGGYFDIIYVNNAYRHSNFIRGKYVGDGSNVLTQMRFGTNDIERMIIDENGRIGMGTLTPAATLDVNGEIRLSNTGLVCSPATEGTLRYNWGSHQVEFCNGNNSNIWTALGGDAPSGTICGISRDGPHLCMGHNPEHSCPPGYHQIFFGWRGVGTNACQKN